MVRYTFPAFNNASRPRYVVVWDFHWHMMACQRVEPATDLSGAMAAAIDQRPPSAFRSHDEQQFFKALGARIAQLREEAGLSQQAVADALKIAQQTNANYEVARQTCRVDAAHARATLWRQRR